MKKKDLIKQNYVLFERLQTANSEVLRLRYELEKLKKEFQEADKTEQNGETVSADTNVAEQEKLTEISSAQPIAEQEETMPAAETELSEDCADEIDVEPEETEFETSEEPITESFSDEETADISEIRQYGAEAIGKIVLQSAQNCNQLTAGGETRYKELVNLMLGKAEVAKGDILQIVLSEDPLTEQKAQIDVCREEALEYFETVMRQKD